MALDVNTIKTVSIIAIGVLVLLAVLFAAIVTKLITRVVLIVVVLGLAGVVYWQRDELATCAQTCDCTFFGQQVTLPEDQFPQCPR